MDRILLKEMRAKELLYGFDVPENERDFIISSIVSGNVPKWDLDELYRLSLTTGLEQWDMLIAHAISMRTHDLGSVEGTHLLLPYISRVLDGTGGNDKEKCAVSEEKNGGTSAGIRARKDRGPTATSHFFNGLGGTAGSRAAKGRGQNTASETQGIHRRIQDERASGGPWYGPASSRRSCSPSANLVRGRGSIREDEEQITGSHTVSTPHNHTPAIPDNVMQGSEGARLQVDERNKAAEGMTTEKRSAQEAGKRVTRATKSPFWNTLDQCSKPTNPAGQHGTSRHKRSRPAAGLVSSVPFPPLSAPRFGIIQEELAPNPFQLLIAVTLLIKTAGRAAVPVFRQLAVRHPTPESLVAVNRSDIVSAIHHLGLSSRRSKRIQDYAREWINRPPSRHVRYGVKNYPRQGDGRDVRAGQEFGPEDGNTLHDDEEAASSRGTETAWEIGHLTQGRYAIDSWRIFCRDVLLGRANDWKGAGREPEFQPEWMRVLPEDKELRACLRWMWMREGWEWDPVTGEREILSQEMRSAVDERRVRYNDMGQLVMADEDPGD